VLDATAASIVSGRAEVDVDGDGLMEEVAAETTSRDFVLR